MEDITEGTEITDLSSFDLNALNKMYQSAGIESLAKRICSVVPMEAPVGGVFNIKRKDGTNDFELVRNNVDLFEDIGIIKTSISQEAYYDMKALFSKEADKIIGKLLKGIANEKENDKLIEFLDVNAKVVTDITITDKQNAEVIIFELTKYLTELVIKMNLKNYKTYQSFAVIPMKEVAAFMALSQYISNEDEQNERNLFIGRNGVMRYYVNPNPDATEVYVGLINKFNEAKSSIIMSPYQNSIVHATNQASGEKVMGILDRFALTMNPLHSVGDEMLYKFNIL